MLIFIYGKNDFLSRRKLEEFKDKYRREVDPSGLSLGEIDGESAPLDEIGRSLGAPSLFARRRFTVIKNIFSRCNGEDLEAIKLSIVSGPKASNNDNIVAFWERGDSKPSGPLFDYLAGAAHSFLFEEADNAKASEWIRQEAAAQGAELPRRAADYLVSVFGTDYWRLSAETDKIIAYKRGLESSSAAVEISQADIEAVSGGDSAVNVFNLTDALANRKREQALYYLEREIQSDSLELQIISRLSWQIKNLIKVKSGLAAGAKESQLAKNLKLHPYVVQKTAAAASRHSLEDLKKLFFDLLEIERQMKSGLTEPMAAVSLLIAKI